MAEDGHREQGVLAFAVGSGRGGAVLDPRLERAAVVDGRDASRAASCSARWPPPGVFAFWLLMRRLFADELSGLVPRLLFFGLFPAFVGAGGLVHTTAGGTRFALLVKLAAIVAAAGAAAAALRRSRARCCSRSRASAPSALAAMPAFAGHALDRGSPRWLAVPVDLLHLGSAAVWIGGLLTLLAVLRGSGRGRSGAGRRRTPVLVRGARRSRRAGRERRRPQPERARLRQPGLVDLLRAGAARQDRALPAAPRHRPAEPAAARPGAGRLGRPFQLELAVLVAILAVVGVLTDLRPGQRVARPAAEAGPAATAARPALIRGRRAPAGLSARSR